MHPLGLYIHVPFCSTTCGFCAFYQGAPKKADITLYLEGIGNEIALRKGGARANERVQTVFWGGGTPGLLPVKDMQRLGELTLEACGGAPPEEWSIELAPANVTKPKLRALKAMGVTRISMGVQSFNPLLLKALEREHSPAQVMRAYQWIREAGFASVNIDLMFALPGQTQAQWMADLTAAVNLGTEHISTYCLTFEEDTALWVKLSKGAIKRSIAAEADMYTATWNYLQAQGFTHYEVANFAKPGHACAHNLNTWRMHPWLGLGPSAASQYAGARDCNEANLHTWAASLKKNQRALRETEPLTPHLLLTDALLFGLRLPAPMGIRLNEIFSRFAQGNLPTSQQKLLRARLQGLFESLQAEGLVTVKGDHVCCTQAGLLRADAIAGELLDVLDIEDTETLAAAAANTAHAVT